MTSQNKHSQQACAIYLCPWDSGTRDVRFATAPKFLNDCAPVQQVLSQKFSTVKIKNISTIVDVPPVESATTFRLINNLAEQVAELEDHFPVLFSGNCIFSTGVLLGLYKQTDAAKTGLIWFDAHADFNTPDTSVSGFICGTSVSLIAGQCFHEQVKRIPAYEPLSEENIVLVGVRDVDPAEQKRLENSDIKCIDCKDFSSTRQWLAHCEKLYLHFDMDVLDPEEAIANELQPDHGLRLDEITRFISQPAIKSRIAGITFASIDPALDGEKIANCVSTILAEI